MTLLRYGKPPERKRKNERTGQSSLLTQRTKTKLLCLDCSRCGSVPAMITFLVLLLRLAGSVSAQTLTTPDWLARALTNRPQFAAPTNAPFSLQATNPAPASAAGAIGAHVGGLSEQDVAMANAVIAENTLTLRLPVLYATRDSPGPLTEADPLVLLATNATSVPPPASPKHGRGQDSAVTQPSNRPFPELAFRIYTNN